MTQPFRALLSALIVGFVAMTPAAADTTPAHLVVTKSPHTVSDTLDRLEAAVTSRGATVMARVDHAAGAASIDAELGPMQLLIFGNPRLGTPLLQAAPTVGLDLPVHVLAWSDADGATHVAYTDPAALAARHGVADDHPAIARMTGVLSTVVGEAVAHD